MRHTHHLLPRAGAVLDGVAALRRFAAGQRFTLAALLVFGAMLLALTAGRQAEAAPPTITIDGNMADWASVIRFDDLTTDAGGGSTDLQGIYLTGDGTSLAARWETKLASNRTRIQSDAFSVSIDTTGTGAAANARLWVTFNSSGVATAELEKPIGTFTVVPLVPAASGAAQDCLVIACTAGGLGNIEAKIPLASLAPPALGTLIGLNAETRASASHAAAIKDWRSQGVIASPRRTG